MAKPLFRLVASKKSDKTEKLTLGTLWAAPFPGPMNLNLVKEPKEKYNEARLEDVDPEEYYLSVQPVYSEGLLDYTEDLKKEKKRVDTRRASDSVDEEF